MKRSLMAFGLMLAIPWMVARAEEPKKAESEPFKKLSVNEGLILVASPPSELDRYFREEEDRWRKVIQDAGIKAD